MRNMFGAAMVQCSKGLTARGSNRSIQTMNKPNWFSPRWNPLWPSSSRHASWLNGMANSRAGARSPLARHLLARIFGLYFSVALVVTVVQACLQYGNELEKLQSEVTAAVQLMEPALSKSMWNIDKPGTSAIAEGLSRNKSLVGLRLDSNPPISLGMTPDNFNSQDGNSAWKNRLLSKLYGQQFPIRHPESDHPDKLVGTLHVYASAGTVVERATNVMLTMVVSAIIKTGALWLILYVTITGMIARPLIKLAAGLNRINLEHRAELQPLQLTPRVRKPDEMKFLLLSFVAMRRALRRSKRKLLGYQSELEQKVLDRTRDLHDQAMHDALTGLLNRRAFATFMSDLLYQPLGVEVKHVFCMIDLDHFKLVNDTFGHAVGDQVLCQVAELLKRNSRPEDLVARLGGDEFAIVMRDCSLGDAQAKLSQLANEVSGILAQVEGRRVSIGMSAGLAAFSARTGADLRAVMENADAACYAAKESGRYQVRVYREGAVGMRRKADIRWVNVIHKALAEDQFLLYVQPIHASSDNAIARVEVLIRLRLDDTVIPPGAFLPAAERYGLSSKIDEWVLERTLRYLATHPEFVKRVGVVHINLSASAIAAPQFYRFAVRQIRRHPLPPGKICLEVTENAAIDRLDDAVRIMNGLRRHGMTFALDDFGHGASSYTYLQTLPVDQVKIDGSFVSTIVENEVSLAIVKSMTDIAHMAGMTVVAEYVENDAIASKLRELHVDYLQGYLLSEPMPIESLLKTMPPVSFDE